MDHEGAIGSVYIREVSISNRSCYKSQKYTFFIEILQHHS